MKILIVAAMLAAAAPAAQAASFTAAAHGSYAIDQDTEEGSFSEWKVLDLSGMNALRAKTQIRRLGTHERWAPGFGLSVGNDDEEIKFALVSATRQPPLLLYIEHIKGGKKIKEEMFLTQVGLDEAFELAMDWTAQGQVTVSVDSAATRKIGSPETHRMDLPFAPTQLRVIGSTGEWSLDPLRLGHSEP